MHRTEFTRMTGMGNLKPIMSDAQPGIYGGCALPEGGVVGGG